RDHRNRDLRRCRSRGRDAGPVARAGVPHRAGRFRHRLFVALQHPHLRAGRAEDRPQLHRRDAARARIDGD
ncbi:hypothetical protein LTR94_037475, partial [Friedmanniomyces endolithicus]